MNETKTFKERCGVWENVFTELEADTWNAGGGDTFAGMFGGIELSHNGNHIGVLYPDGGFRTTYDTFSLPEERERIVEKRGETYLVQLNDDKTYAGKLVVYRLISRECEHSSSSSWNYCPHCGEKSDKSGYE